MISFEDFLRHADRALNRRIGPDDNRDQYQAIKAAPESSLFIVAGPGSGKTTVLALKILKLVYVDGVDPSSILATTFTRKAAAELRSRILGWGDQLAQAIQDDGATEAFPDLNQIITGTLDSIADGILREYRSPGASLPVIIDDFTATTLLLQHGLLTGQRNRDDFLKNYLLDLRGTAYGFSTTAMAKMLYDMHQRFAHDQASLESFGAVSGNRGVRLAAEVIQDFRTAMDERGFYDYARLEEELLARLANGSLARLTDRIRFVMVDEYQDTNLLQEQIYFTLAEGAIRNSGSLSVVGDDDQSVYRFRGATVDLFVNFPARVRARLGVEPTPIFLSNNYRSTSSIVRFDSDFIRLDQTYQQVRVRNKPALIPSRREPYTNYPVLGLFRDTLEALVTDLATFIGDVVQGNGASFRWRGEEFTVRTDPSGSPGDLCLLCSSPLEEKDQGAQRLPGLLRRDLLNRYSIRVFNPRGLRLEQVPHIEYLCGMMLLCLDPEGAVLQAIDSVPNTARAVMEGWRQTARALIDADDALPDPAALRAFVHQWASRSTTSGEPWPREVSPLKLVYKLLSWYPDLQTDIEGLAYLEVVTRAIAQSGLLSRHGGLLIVDPANPSVEISSIRDLYRYLFVPLASRVFDINEDLYETLPSGSLPIMSIHQAKGLEYPLVIVDIGSEFRTNHPSQAFKRFPAEGGETSAIEDDVRSHSPLGPPRRFGRDRSFDDLYRQYFVAYSRPQDVLLLVGLTSVIDGYRNASGKLLTIPNVATGWSRNEDWRFGRGLDRLLRI